MNIFTGSAEEALRNTINELAWQIVYVAIYMAGTALIANVILHLIPLPHKVKEFLLTVAMLLSAFLWSKTLLT